MCEHEKDHSDEGGIPSFLQRNPDNSVRDVYMGAAPVGITAPVAVHGVDQAHEPVGSAEPRPAPVANEFAVIKKKKSYARINKLKVVKADREAVKAGKTWDATTAKWV